MEEWIRVPHSASDPPCPDFSFVFGTQSFPGNSLMQKRVASVKAFIILRCNKYGIFYKNNPHVSYIYIGTDCSFFIIFLENLRKVESRNIRMILETLFNISGWKFLLLSVFVLLLTWLLYKVVFTEDSLSSRWLADDRSSCHSLSLCMEDFLKWFVFGLNSTPPCLSCIQDLDLALVGNYTIDNDWDWLLLVGRFLDVKSLAEISMLLGSYLIRNEPFQLL